jgi:hypothetical protein
MLYVQGMLGSSGFTYDFMCVMCVIHTGFAKGMLEVADCLEKALEAVPAEKRTGNAELQSVFEGMELIDKVFLKALRYVSFGTQ